MQDDIAVRMMELINQNLKRLAAACVYLNGAILETMNSPVNMNAVLSKLQEAQNQIIKAGEEQTQMETKITYLKQGVAI